MGRPDPVVVPIEQVREARRTMESADHTGKIVLEF